MVFETHRYIECYCPQCQKIHNQMVEKAHINNPDAWRKDGRIVVLCSVCKESFRKRSNDE